MEGNDDSDMNQMVIDLNQMIQELKQTIKELKIELITQKVNNKPKLKPGNRLYRDSFPFSNIDCKHCNMLIEFHSQAFSIIANDRNGSHWESWHATCAGNKDFDTPSFRSQATDKIVEYLCNEFQWIGKEIPGNLFKMREIDMLEIRH